MNLSSLSRNAVTKASTTDKFVTLSPEAMKEVVGGRYFLDGYSTSITLYSVGVSPYIV